MKWVTLDGEHGHLGTGELVVTQFVHGYSHPMSVALLITSLLLLFGALGAGVGALLMLWVAAVKIGGAVTSAMVGRSTGAVIAAVMSATDALLFSVVLITFIFAITFGFVIDPSPEARARLPGWVKLGGIAELKKTLVEVILVFLVVDFATDVAGAEGHLGWTSLVLPVAALFIALVLRLWPAGAMAESG